MYEEYRNLPDDIRRTMEAFGTPDEIHQRLEDFSDKTGRLLAMKEKLVEKHPNQWAVLYGEEVVVGKSLPRLIRERDERGFKGTPTAVRFLWTEKPVMII